jgi:nitrate reductase delta subunit
MRDAEFLMDSLAGLLEYPNADFFARLRHCSVLAGVTSAPVRSELQALRDALEGMTLAQVQELYVAAFDMDPDCCLDLGWHLYGERRERGDLLVRLRDALHVAGVMETTQLPDHVTHVLRLLARHQVDGRGDLATQMVPALRQVRTALEGRRSPYARLIAAVECAIADVSMLAKGQDRV